MSAYRQPYIDPPPRAGRFAKILCTLGFHNWRYKSHCNYCLMVTQGNAGGIERCCKCGKVDDTRLPHCVECGPK